MLMRLSCIVAALLISRALEAQHADSLSNPLEVHLRNLRQLFTCHGVPQPNDAVAVSGNEALAVQHKR